MDIKQIRLRNLSKIIDEKHQGKKSSFASDLNISPTVVSRWFSASKTEHSRSISNDMARKIEDFYSLYEGWMDTIHYNNYSSEARGGSKIAEDSPATEGYGNRRIPLFEYKEIVERFDRNHLNSTNHQNVSQIPIPAGLNLSSSAYATKMSGDAMTSEVGQSIPDQATVYVEPNEKEKNLDVVLVVDLENKNLMIKQIVFDGPNSYLKSFNNDYKMIQFGHNHKIIGVVVKALADTFTR